MSSKEEKTRKHDKEKDRSDSERHRNADKLKEKESRDKGRDSERHRDKESDRHRESDRYRDREKESDKRRRDSDRHKKDSDRDGRKREPEDRNKDKKTEGKGTEKSTESRKETSRKRVRETEEEKDSNKKPRTLLNSTITSEVIPSPAESTSVLSEEDEVKLARKKKLQELAALLKKQKEQLEKEKVVVLRKKKREEEEKRKESEFSIGGKDGIPELRLNTHLQAIDKYGKVAGPVIRHATLLVNKRAIEKKLQPILKRTAELLPASMYFDPNTAGKGRRRKKGFNWIQPGHYIKEAEKERLEKDKKVDKAKKNSASSGGGDVGDEDMVDVDEGKSEGVPPLVGPTSDIQKLMRDERRAFIGKIPAVEWWDRPFLKVEKLSSMSYGDDSKDVLDPNFSVWKLETLPAGISSNVSAIDSDVFHPAPLRPAAEPPPPPPQPLPLTRKELKRITKQTREAKRQAEIDAIMIGAKEPPPPRVRLANIPRVYSQQAMQDPTAIEMMVRDEMGNRLTRHHERNQERKLTKEQRCDKKKAKMFEDTTLYSHVAVYKILVPLSGQNKFKIDRNAQQTFLKGCCLMIVPESAQNSDQNSSEKNSSEKNNNSDKNNTNSDKTSKNSSESSETQKKPGENSSENGIPSEPSWSLVVVEGGPKALRRYKKLMLRRMKWVSAEKSAASETKNDGEKDPVEIPDSGSSSVPSSHPLSSSPLHPCFLVWEGEVLQGTFHDFQMKNMKNEFAARKFLQDRGCVHYWDMANHFLPPEIPQTI